MNSFSESFARFSTELNQIAEFEGKKAAMNWEDTLQNGRLTHYICDTFSQIDSQNKDILNSDRGRSTTIQASLFEIFLGKLIKSLLETRMKDEAVEVVLDTYLPLNNHKIYPDILIKKDKTSVGIIELKHSLKKHPYENTERKRRVNFLSQFPSLKTYSIIVYNLWDKSALSSIVEDDADWIYIIRYGKSAKQYRDGVKVPFVHRANPIELALNEIINA